MGNVVLGRTYRDAITGFEGVATIRYDTVGGDVFYTLTRQMIPDTGKIPRERFHVSQLVDSKGHGVAAPKLPKSDIRFGEEYVDRITGLKGRTSQRAQHIDGCIQWALDPPVNAKGELLPGYFFDDARILAPETKTPVEKAPSPKGPDNDDRSTLTAS